MLKCSERWLRRQRFQICLKSLSALNLGWAQERICRRQKSCIIEQRRRGEASWGQNRHLARQQGLTTNAQGICSQFKFSCWQRNMDMDRKMIKLWVLQGAVKKVQMKDGSTQSFYLVRIFVRSQILPLYNKAAHLTRQRWMCPRWGASDSAYWICTRPRMNDVDAFFLFLEASCLGMYYAFDEMCPHAGDVQTVT